MIHFVIMLTGVLLSRKACPHVLKTAFGQREDKKQEIWRSQISKKFPPQGRKIKINKNN